MQRSSSAIRGMRSGSPVCRVLLAITGAVWMPLLALAQPASPSEAVGNVPPRVFWKQKLFSIPYRLNRAADAPDAPVEVQLFVSSDQGRSWKQISRARPEVQHFTYAAPADGEYWFAVRTVDSAGQTHPSGPHTAQLRVVVDTTPPTLELHAMYDAQGRVRIGWDVEDGNPNPVSLSLKAKAAEHLAWQPIVLPPAQQDPSRASASGVHQWTVPRQTTPQIIRGEVSDLAGNRTVVQADVKEHSPPNINSNPLTQTPPGGDATTDTIGTGAETRSENPGGPRLPPVAGPSLTPRQEETRPREDAAPPGDDSHSSPAAPRFSSVSRPSTSVEPPTLRSSAAHDVPSHPYASTPYPSLPTAPPAATDRESPRTRLPVPPLVRRTNEPASQEASPSSRHFTAPPLALSGGGSAARPQDRGGAERGPVAAVRSGESEPTRIGTPPARPSGTPQRPVGDEAGQADRPRMVNSRRFALEYELNAIGPSGIAAVELWGTSDGGKTWALLTRDDDNRSPIEAAVDGEGEYGFKLLVQSAGGYGTPPPRPGDAPDMRVRVDLLAPTVSLTGVHLGSGNLTDHIVIRWNARDEFLDDRPVTLSYASRPSGPWTIIATGLENTGYYAWRLQRHIPETLFIRVQVRDQAGNAGVFQAADPFMIQRPRPSGLLRNVRPVDE